MIIAHRGASGELPEHTIAAYRRAIEQGADVIEPDLVMTRDGALIVRHDRYLSTTTDVADRPEFADRRRRVFDGRGFRNDWWAEDFTLEEIKTLRAKQPRADRPADFNGQFDVPTFEEVIELAKEFGIPVYPETKAPTAHAEAGLDMEAALLAALQAAGWTTADAPVFVQSFEADILRSLNEKTDVTLVQLVYAGPSIRRPRANISLDAIVEYADGVGPSKGLVIDGQGADTGFVSEAHALGLFVHPWTVRDDQPVAPDVDVSEELNRLFDAGVDGVFVDFPQTAVEVRATYCSGT